MYDVVRGECPHCGAEHDMQSKAGYCNMEVFGIDEIPAGIAVDLLQEQYPWNTTCFECKGTFRFVSEVPLTVRGRLVKDED